jgi:hypothetical protein
LSLLCLDVESMDALAELLLALFENLGFDRFPELFEDLERSSVCVTCSEPLSTYAALQRRRIRH